MGELHANLYCLDGDLPSASGISCSNCGRKFTLDNAEILTEGAPQAAQSASCPGEQLSLEVPQ